MAYWISESDEGIYDAWNKGIANASGEWIMFLGSGDLLYADAISEYVTYINQCSNEVDYISARVELIDEAMHVKRIVGQAWTWSKFRVFMNVAHVGSFHNVRLFENKELFNSTYKISGDYEFLLRKSDKLKAGFLNKVVAKMVIGGVSSLSIKSLQETLQAKIDTGARKKIFAYYDYLIAFAKQKVRKVMGL